ncbi:RITA1 protein, partial [Serilophus lunatus]|nr:RITA1 protein [Serilophus lunatus]
ARPPRGPRGRRRARASFVDESLFGSPAGARPAPPAFAPPWAAPAAPASPRPRSHCRGAAARGAPPRPLSRSHAPSFCDESLFGAKPQGPAWTTPWMRKEDIAKLHMLLWSPPPAPRNQPGLSPCSRGAPLRAVHPPASAPPGTAGSEPAHTGKSCGWKCPQSGACSESRAARGTGRSQSISRLSTPLDRLHLASDNLGTERWNNQSAPTTPAAPRGSLMRGQSQSVSGAPVVRNAKAGGCCKPRPPWK